MESLPRPSVSQKDYLKKYFSKSKNDKQKKKKVKLSSSSHLKRSQIIDDDLNLNAMADVDDDEFNLAYLGDEAPQIAGIIDERPEHIKAMEVYADSNMWKSVGEGTATEDDLWGKKASSYKNDDIILRGIDASNKFDLAEENKYQRGDKRDGKTLKRSAKDKTSYHNICIDKSVDRTQVGKNNNFLGSPSRKNDDVGDSYDDLSLNKKTVNNKERGRRRDSDSDLSPQRKGQNVNRNQKYYGSDQSPPRMSKGNVSRNRRDSDSDQSRPRKSRGNVSRKRRDSDSDQSPPRKSKGNVSRKRRDSDSDQSPPRKSKGNVSRNRRDSDSDQSPPRKSKGNVSRKHRDSDSDQSPPRKSKGNVSRNRRDSDSDQSPPRKSKGNVSRKHRDSDSDQSPPRKSKGNVSRKRRDSDSDQSPPRKSKGNGSRGHRDSDIRKLNQLPPRKYLDNNLKRGSGQSSSRNSVFKNERGHQKNMERDLSPHRRKNDEISRNQRSDSFDPPSNRRTHENYRKGASGRDNSPSRKLASDRNHDKAHDSRESRKNNKNIKRREDDRDRSPSRRSSGSCCSDERDHYVRKEGKSRLDDESKYSSDRIGDTAKRTQDDHRSAKNTTNRDGSSGFSQFKNNSSNMEKTLDGKKAGLQDAKNLREELASLREQEDRMFKNMDSTKFGAGSEAVVRDRKTGKIKDFVEEQKESREKMQQRLARQEKYSRWSKGLKQLEDTKSKIVDNMREMSKPVARYKDDSDLDAFLKAQEREGDPMLDYIRKKQSESHPVQKLKPRYEGSYAPNRFNIRPGHRWDGVDRSNGFESKWFESINAKKAIQEEAYKWSSSDM